MVLVPSDDRPRVPRVGPKVFADVPSTAEVTKLKRSRGAFFVALVFLLGLLVAVGGFAAYLWQQQQQHDEQIADIEKERNDAEAEVEKWQADYRRDTADYTEFNRLRGEVNGFYTQIKEHLAEVPAAAENLPRRDSVFRAYDANSGVWTRQQTATMRDLEDESQKMEAELAAVRRYRAPPRPGPSERPRPVDLPRAQ